MQLLMKLNLNVFTPVTIRVLLPFLCLGELLAMQGLCFKTVDAINNKLFVIKPGLTGSGSVYRQKHRSQP